LICREPADLYSARSRRVIGRLCREFLDRTHLTPIELLHSPTAQRQYLERGTDYQAAAQKAAVAQARAAGQEVGQRMRELYAVVDTAVRNAAERLTQKPPPALDPTTFAAFVSTARKAELTEVHDFFANAALIAYLADRKTWTEKIGRLRTVADGARDPAVSSLVDALMAEIVASGASLHEFIGPPVPFGAFVGTLIDLLRAPEPPAIRYSEAGGKLRDFLSHHALPETRSTLVEHIRAGLSSKTPLAPGPPPADLEAHLRLLNALTRAGDAAGGENMRALLGERIVRVLSIDALSTAMRRFPRVDDRMIEALNIHRRLGDSPGRLEVRQYVDFLFESERLVATLAKAPEPKAEKLRRIARLHDALQNCGFSSIARAKYDQPLRTLQAELLKNSAASGSQESAALPVATEAPKTALTADDRRTPARVHSRPEDHVIINNVRFALRNWSPRGLLFGPMANVPSVGDKIALKVAVMLGNDRARFDAVGEVMRVAGGEVAVRYECTSPEAALRIKSYFDSLK
jgi:hypothetical protein